MTKVEISKLIKSQALSFGFDACGIAKVERLSSEESNLLQWISNGYYADMEWMTKNMEKRIDPRLLVKNAKSVIVVLKNYTVHNFPFENKKYKISRYALGVDYHKVIKKKLKSLFQFINEMTGSIVGRYFVDSAPVLEKAWAVKAGLGWIGKNSLLLHRKLGSYCFIGEILVDVELEYDTPINNMCGTCTYCIEACPTGAIIEPKIVDSRKCISYHTIENRGEIPDDVQQYMHNWIFGCDICQEVCPWNWRVPEHNEPQFSPKKELISISDEQFEQMNEITFIDVFAGSAVKRTKFNGLIRNILAVKNNS